MSLMLDVRYVKNSENVELKIFSSKHLKKEKQNCGKLLYIFR